MEQCENGCTTTCAEHSKREPTYAMGAAFTMGKLIKVGKTNYMGKNPEFEFVNGMRIKTKPGVPFINLDKLNLPQEIQDLVDA